VYFRPKLLPQLGEQDANLLSPHRFDMLGCVGEGKFNVGNNIVDRCFDLEVLNDADLFISEEDLDLGSELAPICLWVAQFHECRKRHSPAIRQSGYPL